MAKEKLTIKGKAKMKFIVKFKWVIAAFILALTVILMLTAPNLTKLASEKGSLSFLMMPFHLGPAKFSKMPGRQ